MSKTPYTATARRHAKKLLAMYNAGQIQIWGKGEGFQVMTFERAGHCYGSDTFPTKSQAFNHIIVRAACTGFDLQRFSAIADRYFNRFLA
jgi:hypothetical protein